MENKQSKPTRQQVILSPVNYCLTKKDVTEANSDESIVDSNRKGKEINNCTSYTPFIPKRM